MNKVAVLLSVYNGSSYLRKLLDSLLNQTYKSFDLIVRDDGSVDNSIAILKEYEPHLNIKWVGRKLKKTTHNVTNLAKSFIFLTEYAFKHHYDYYFFCDQDDIWLQNKIKDQVNYLYKVKYPCLVHSDLILIDENDNIIANSVWLWQKINPYRNNYKMLLFQNTVTGCAAAFNKKLASLLFSIPEKINHDNWASIIASIEGKVVPIEKKLIFYRQHNKNISGAGEKLNFKFTRTVSGFLVLVLFLFCSLFKKNFNFKNTKFNDTYILIDEAKRIGRYVVSITKNLPQNDIIWINKLLKLEKLSFYKRVMFIKNSNFLPDNFYRKTFLLILLLFKRN